MREHPQEILQLAARGGLDDYVQVIAEVRESPDPNAIFLSERVHLFLDHALEAVKVPSAASPRRLKRKIHRAFRHDGARDLTATLRRRSTVRTLRGFPERSLLHGARI